MAEFSIGGLLSDPNFLQLLAGVGTRLDPQGAGGLIGVPTSNYLSSVAAQGAGAKIAAQPQGAITNYNQLNERLGDFTPEGTPGPTSIKARPNGGYAIEGNLHPTLMDARDTQAGVDELISPITPTLNAPQRQAPSLGGISSPSEVEKLVDFPYAPTTGTAAPTTPTAAPVARVAQGGQVPSPFRRSETAEIQSPSTIGGIDQLSPSGPRSTSGTPRYTAGATITPDDLRGLNPAQVSQLISQSLQASQIETSVAGLIGRDIGNERQNRLMAELAAQKAREVEGASYSAAKLATAKAIASSNLTPDRQQVLFDRLDAATTLPAVRNELVEAGKLSPLINSSQERDDYARQMFGGKNYSQATAVEQAAINKRITDEKVTWQIQANESGLYRLNQKTGDAYPIIGPTGTGAPAPGGTATAPTGGAAGGAAPSDVARMQNVTLEMARKYLPNTQNLSDEAVLELAAKNIGLINSKMTPAERQAIAGQRVGMTDIPATPGAPTTPGVSGTPVPPVAAKPLTYQDLSPFAKSVSLPGGGEPGAGKPGFGATKPTEAQMKAYSAGNAMLESHEIVHNLATSAQPELGTGYWQNEARMLGDLSVSQAATVGGGIGASAGAAFGGIKGSAVVGAIGGAAGILGNLAGPALANYFASPQEQSYFQARANFVTSYLRWKSGAVINTSEFVNDYRRFFAQPGDTPSQLEQKARTREQVIRDAQTESGRMLVAPTVTVPGPATPSAPAPPTYQGTPPPSGPVPTLEDIGTRMLRQQEELRQQMGPPPQTLPVKPQSQLQNAPNLKPTAALPIEHIPYLQAMKAMTSKDIVSGLADSYLSEVGPKTLTQQSSYFGPSQRAAIRSRVARLKLEDTVSMLA